MIEYRPDARDLWQKISANLPLVRRAALALGGMMLGYGLARAMGGRFDMTLLAALGGGLVGFFAPSFERRS